jgi:hypothetical protein
MGNARSNPPRDPTCAAGPAGRHGWMLGLAVAAIFFSVGGETRANKQAIAAFRTRWEQPSPTAIVLSVDPASVKPPETDLGQHTLSVESAGPLGASSVADWNLITNLPSGFDRFTVNPFATNVSPMFYRLKLVPR